MGSTDVYRTLGSIWDVGVKCSLHVCLSVCSSTHPATPLPAHPSVYILSPVSISPCSSSTRNKRNMSKKEQNPTPAKNRFFENSNYGFSILHSVGHQARKSVRQAGNDGARLTVKHWSSEIETETRNLLTWVLGKTRRKVTRLQELKARVLGSLVWAECPQDSHLP